MKIILTSCSYPHTVRINLIEHYRSYLKDRVRKFRPANKETLLSAIETAQNDCLRNWINCKVYALQSTKNIV